MRTHIPLNLSLLSQIIIIAIAFLPFIYQSSSTHNYSDALSKSLLYFESQRSGRLPHLQRATWRHHSALLDGLEQGVDLVGGYYDAGDNVKFGLPMAFTITMLSWGVIEYGKDIAALGEYQHALEAIKWGTDYFIKAHTSPNLLWVQVGDGDSDHYCWQRPEDMTTSRLAFKVDENNPGSEVAGETAAAMAASSIVFRKTNPHYSQLLLHHAQQIVLNWKQVFEFGDKYRGKYDESVKIVKGFYESTSGYKDELLWSAIWLYKATNNQTYLNYALENAFNFGGATWAVKEFSWDIKFAGLQLLLSKEKRHRNASIILESYRSNAEYFMCACLNKNNPVNDNVHITTGGLIFIRQWNNLQYVSAAVFLLTLYSDHIQSTNQRLKCGGSYVDPPEILRFAKSQVDYMLGDNPMNMSYLVGYGTRYPQRVHHRGASTISLKEHNEFIGCVQGYDIWYKRKGPNPNVLVGALVGGPDENDVFRDERDNHEQTEACTYNTATLVGVLARLNRRQEKEGALVDKCSSSVVASIYHTKKIEIS
ncbi:Endoglucanase 11 [Linum perenne]